jgi:hypothetical protein
MMNSGSRPWAERPQHPFDVLLTAIGEQTRRDYRRDLRELLMRYRKRHKRPPEGDAEEVIGALVDEFEGSAPAADMTEVERFLFEIGCDREAVTRFREEALKAVLSGKRTAKRKNR